MEESDYEKQFNCSASYTKSTSNDSNTIIRKKCNMVLQLGMKNSVSSDQTPTPTRFIRNCEEVGLFQDLLNVNPFEETFRKAAEAAKAGVITPLQVSNVLEGGSLNGDDTLHTPHVFPSLSETAEQSTGSSQSGDVDTGISNDANNQKRSFTTGILCNQQQKSDKVVKQEADTSQSKLVSAEKSNLICQSSESSVTTTSTVCTKSSTDQSPVQVLLRIPDGHLIQLSVVQVDGSPKEVANDVVSVTENSEFNAANGSKTVVLTTGEFQIDSGKPVSLSSNHINSVAKQKLKQALLGNTCPATSTESNNPECVDRITEPRKIALSRKPDCIVEKQPSIRNGNLFSSEDEEEDKRKKVLERNRMAAMRCRKKRKCWVAELELKATQMSNTNQQLQQEVKLLRAEVASLKSLLLAHKDCPVTQAITQGLGNPLVPSTTQVFSVSVPITHNKELSRTTVVSQNSPTVILLNPPNTQVKKRLQPASHESNLQHSVKKKICANSTITKSGAHSEKYRLKRIDSNRRVSVDTEKVTAFQINERLLNTTTVCSSEQSSVREVQCVSDLQNIELVNIVSPSDDAIANKPVATKVIQLNPNALHRENCEFTVRLPDSNESELNMINVQPIVTATYR